MKKIKTLKVELITTKIMHNSRVSKYFDIVNEQDEVIGKATAQECHSNPKLLHRVVHFTDINAQDKTILVGKRPIENAYDGGKWCFFGEHVLSGEHYHDAFVRGLKNELGLTQINGRSWRSPHIFNYSSQREIALFMIGYLHKEMPLKPDASEIEKTQWLSVEELRQSSKKFSDITNFWINHTKWEQLL